MEKQEGHIPVLREEVERFLSPRPGDVIFDGTFGGGGYAESILRLISPGGTYIGVDRDPEAIERAGLRFCDCGESLRLFNGNFADITDIIRQTGAGEVNGMVFDLGLSSYQLDDPRRGFSFNQDGPLDARFNQTTGLSAADIVNTWSEDELIRILREYAEERRFARRIAGFIVRQRQEKPFTTTGELADCIARAVPRRFWPRKIHVATKSFQGIRLAVNSELESLDTLLNEFHKVLAPGGRAVFVSFNSLEDRRVKHRLRELASGEGSVLELLTRKPVCPGMEEVERNPRARSAKLRAAARTVA